MTIKTLNLEKIKWKDRLVRFVGADPMCCNFVRVLVMDPRAAGSVPVDEPRASGFTRRDTAKRRWFVLTRRMFLKTQTSLNTGVRSDLEAVSCCGRVGSLYFVRTARQVNFSLVV